MTEDELLECQHCGERNLELQQIDIRQKEGQLVCLLCPNCGSSGPTGYCESKDEGKQFEFAKTLYKERVFPAWLREKIVKERDIFESEISKQSHPYDTHTDRKCVASAQLLWVLSLTPGDNP